VLITAVASGGTVERAGLRPGDVLLDVAGAPVGSIDELRKAVARLPAAVTYWRDGQRLEGRLAAAPLGVTVDPRPAAAAVRAWRSDREATATRGTGHRRLPGTRLEVESLAPLFRKRTTLMGSDASEQKLDELQARGGLKAFRIVHLATHGEVDERSPGRSALILAQDALPDALQASRTGGEVYDGRLTVSKIRATWALDADLVVLSACETGLGKDAGGDGLLGFSQAFLSRGARAVVLSRWPVHDAATALLMRRFYENLLGKREGLKAPLGRAAALKEAQTWLRGLSVKQAESAARGLGYRRAVAVLSPWGGYWPDPLEGTLTRGKRLAAPKAQARPYEHPYFWAAFTLVGDPD
jgi:CHAT domain-containing protein